MAEEYSIALEIYVSLRLEYAFSSRIPLIGISSRHKPIESKSYSIDISSIKLVVGSFMALY